MQNARAVYAGFRFSVWAESLQIERHAMKHLRIDNSVQITKEAFERGEFADWIGSIISIENCIADWHRNLTKHGSFTHKGAFGDHLVKIGDHIIVLTDEEYQARVDDPYEECETIVSDWMNRDNAQLWAGEFAPHEWRSIKAVLNAILIAIRNLGETNDLQSD